MNALSASLGWVFSFFLIAILGIISWNQAHIPERLNISIAILSATILVLGNVLLFRIFARKQQKGLEQSHKLVSLLRRQRDLLQTVTNYSPGGVFILNERGRFIFSNNRLAYALDLSFDDLLQRTVYDVFDENTAKTYLKGNEDALRSGQVLRYLRCDEKQVILVRHIPMSLAHSVLIMEEDITELTRSQEKQTKNLRLLIDNLVHAIDQRDPHAADHSRKVAALAAALGREMGFDDKLTNAISFAGQMFNLGKLLVSPDILNKREALTAEEYEALQSAIVKGRDLLRQIEFDGPVLEILEAAQSKNDYLANPAAEVVALANAFIALTSERAHRPRFEIQAALFTLQREKKFKQKSLEYLINYLEKDKPSPVKGG